MFYMFLVVVGVLLVANLVILHKFKYDLPFKKWFDWFFVFNKLTCGIHCAILAWTGYIFIYKMVELTAYNVFGDALQLLFVYFVPLLLLFYVESNQRKVYGGLRIFLTCVNLFQIYFLYSNRGILLQEPIVNLARNIYSLGNTMGTVVLAVFVLLELVNLYSLYVYYKYNKYELR